MTFQTKVLAAFTAFAVNGLALTSTTHAALTSQQSKIAFFLPTNVVLENPIGTQRLATDAELATAVVASIQTPKVSKKLSPKVAVQQAFQLGIATSPGYSTSVLGAVSSALAKSATKLTQAVAGAYLGFGFVTTTSDQSAAAALIDTTLLGISNSGLTPAKLNAAYIVATKAAVKNAATNTAGTSVGAAAQFTNNLTQLKAIIKAAVSKSSADYVAISQAVATAVKSILAGGYTTATSQVIIDGVTAGYNAAYAATHGGLLPGKNKRAEVLANIQGAVAQGEGQTTGAGAAGLANYAYNNLNNGPVTDIYGL